MARRLSERWLAMNLRSLMQALLLLVVVVNAVLLACAEANEELACRDGTCANAGREHGGASSGETEMLDSENCQEYVEHFGTRFCVVERINSGQTSVVYYTSERTVLKVALAKTSGAEDHFAREAHWLRALHDTDIAPRLLQSGSRALHMTDIGRPVTRETLPADWEEQAHAILDALRANSCQHNDIKLEEIVVDDHGKMRLTDFGYASCGYRNFDCGLKLKHKYKMRLYRDEDMLIMLRELANPPRHEPRAEVHTIVVWNKADHERILAEAERTFDVLRVVDIQLQERNVQKTIDRFYLGQPPHRSEKGKTPFLLIVIKDWAPNYVLRTVRDGQRLVNGNLYDWKQAMREGRTGFLHCSDNTEESYDNLNALSDGSQLLSLWTRNRPHFSSMRDMFQQLNEVGDVRYLVLRNWEELPGDDFAIDEHSDVDLLTDDYFGLKAIVGGKQFKHNLPKNRPTHGPRVENGGWKVANHVLVRGVKITLDIRSVGDDYFDAKWMQDALDERIFLPDRDIFVASPEHHLFTLFYHAFAHKKKISSTYTKTFVALGERAGVPITEEQARDELYLREILEKWMFKRGYDFVAPSEKSLVSDIFPEGSTGRFAAVNEEPEGGWRGSRLR